MKNNKGQALVTFVLLIPLLIMIASICIDVGYLYIEKRKTDNVIKDAVDYGLDNIKKNNSSILRRDITNIVDNNLDNIKRLNIEINDNKISINILRNKNSVFSFVFKKYNYNINSSYTGSINDSIKKIWKG